MMKYKYLLFDADNTLFNFDAAEFNAFRDTCLELSLDYSLDFYKQYTEINEEQWRQLEKGMLTRDELRVKRFNILVNNIELAKKMADLYDFQLSKQAILFDGAYDLCKKLSQKYDVYIVTNGTLSIQTPRFENSKILDVVKKAYISENVGFSKPSKEYFDHVISDIGEKDLSKYLLIGDSISADISGAYAYGIDSLWLNLHNREFDSRPKYIVNSFEKLVDFFEKW